MNSQADEIVLILKRNFYPCAYVVQVDICKEYGNVLPVFHALK